jgi:GT2 family glycosyltransferase
MTHRYAVVLTHNRPELLTRCVDAIAPQVDEVVVVDNASDPPVEATWTAINVDVVRDPTQPPNLGRMWNEQLDRIAELDVDSSTWDVALICDDVVVPDGWFGRVTEAMRSTNAAAASAHSYQEIHAPYVLTELSNGVDRMCPWAFILRGEAGLRADESMHWWYVDTDLDWQARLNGGTLVAPGPIAANERIGEWTNVKPELGERAGIDGQVFERKWGRA